MAASEHIEKVLASLRQLGPRKLAALGVVGALVFGLTGFAGVMLSRPSYEPLYSGLDRAEIARMGTALKEAGIVYDVGADGASILVTYGQSAQARMILAEKGLPASAGAGYELFDKMGSLGLTSFMQEVTRVRAIEGELARTIQLMRGVRAARVHIVLPDEGSFRRQKKASSASVVLRMDGETDAHAAQAIKHLVAAAVPGLALEQVTVLTTDGRLLSSATETTDASLGRKLELETSVANEVQSNIRKTLAPYLSLKNFQVSVAARLNTDRRETSETTFNPDSRVERSVRVIKESQNSQNASQQNPVSVDRNLPLDRGKTGDGKQSSEEAQKREEVTNYEISSKRVSTVSAGYAIENLSVALLVNRAALGKPEDADARIAEIEQIVASAAGLRKDRGDLVKISAVDFVDADKELDPMPPLSLTELAQKNAGFLLRVTALLSVAAAIFWFFLRPVLRALNPPPPELPELNVETPLLETALDENVLALEGAAPAEDESWPEKDVLDELHMRETHSPQKRLEYLIRHNEDQALAVLRGWMREGTAA